MLLSMCAVGSRGGPSVVDRLRQEIAMAEERLAQAQLELPSKLESLDDVGSLRVQTVRSLVQGALLDLAASLAQATSTNSTGPTRSRSRGLSLDEMIVVTGTPTRKEEGQGRNSSRSTSSPSPPATPVSNGNATAMTQGDKIVVEGDTEVRIHLKQERGTNV